MKLITGLIVLMGLIPAVQAADSPYAAGSGLRIAHQYKEQNGDLPNFHEVHPYLFRGGQPSIEGLSKLKDKGIATIIDLRGNPAETKPEGKLAESLGMKYINLPMSSKAPSQHQVKTFLQTVKKAADGQSGPVFVHCAHGSDRTGCLVGVWRVTQDGFSYDQAYKEMRKYYFSPKFIQLSGTVKKYEQWQSGSSGNNSL
jgi:protein tyrosine/serine phosphatase